MYIATCDCELWRRLQCWVGLTQKRGDAEREREREKAPPTCASKLTIYIYIYMQRCGCSRYIWTTAVVQSTGKFNFRCIRTFHRAVMHRYRSSFLSITSYPMEYTYPLGYFVFDIKSYTPQIWKYKGSYWGFRGCLPYFFLVLQIEISKNLRAGTLFNSCLQQQAFNPRKKVSERVSLGVMHIIRSATLGETFWRESPTNSLAECLGKTLGKTVDETFCAKNSRRESRIGLYAWLPARLSPRHGLLRERQHQYKPRRSRVPLEFLFGERLRMRPLYSGGRAAFYHVRNEASATTWFHRRNHG